MNRDTDTERSHRFSIHDNLPSFDDVVKSLDIEMVALALQFPTCANMCTYCSMPPCSRNMELDEINAKAEMLDTFVKKLSTQQTTMIKHYPERIEI